jgi:hypothetical protein
MVKMDLKDKKNYYKWLLKEFYIEHVSKNIWDVCKKYSLKDNLIFNVSQDFGVIKSIASSLIIQNKENIEFISTTLYGIVQTVFKNSDDNLPTFEDLIEKKEYFIMYELGDMEHSLYKENLAYILNNRIMNGKYNLLFFTSKKPENLLDKQLLHQFKVIDLKGSSYKPVKKDGLY